MRTPHEELIKIQRRLWMQNRDIIEGSITVKESGFAAYEKGYLKAVSKFERVATQDEMLSAIKDARIIYVGDYHTCNQSQRSFLRILKNIIKSAPDIIIGMELIYQKHQDAVNSFIKGKLKEEAFVKKIGLRQRWVFDLWNNFKPLFDFAKYHKVSIVGIDAAPLKATLDERDLAAAKQIIKILEKNPKSKLFVMIGDLHLAHLPDIVSELLYENDQRFKSLILYQNSDSIYWKLAKEGLEDRVSLVKISDNEYCRMHTPPIILQQSYINWLDNEEGEIDFADARNNFMEMVDQIAGFLGINIGKNREKVDVYTSGDLSFLNKLKADKTFSRTALSRIKKQILTSESYYIPQKKIVFLANLSVNHAAEEAVHFIKHSCSGREFSRSPEDAFFANILHEALGFFGSKLVNSKRKCFHEDEFRGLVKYFETVKAVKERRFELETAVLVLEFFALGKDGFMKKWFKKILKTDLFFPLTHALGYILGDKLFYAMMSERISKGEVKEIFYDPWKREGEPQLVYADLNKRLKGVKIPKRM